MAETSSTARTVVGLFETEEAANRAAEEMFRAGFSRDEVGVISGHELSHSEEHVTAPEDSEGKLIGAIQKGLAMGGGLGALAGGVSSLLLPGVGPLVIGGALASAFLGAGLGAAVGGVMAGLMKAGVDESDARLLEAALRHGGVVLTVHTDEARAVEATQILDRNGALDMDKHTPTWGDSGVDHVEGSADGRSKDTQREHSSQQDDSSHQDRNYGQQEQASGQTQTSDQRDLRNRERQNTGAQLETMAQEENARRLEPWGKHGAILGGNASAADFQDEFRQDYQNRYAGTGAGYDRYQPAYAMGERYARDSRFNDRDWSSVEPELRQNWESGGHGSWDDFADAVRRGWDKVRGKS